MNIYVQVLIAPEKKKISSVKERKMNEKEEERKGYYFGDLDLDFISSC